MKITFQPFWIFIFTGLFGMLLVILTLNIGGILGGIQQIFSIISATAILVLGFKLSGAKVAIPSGIAAGISVYLLINEGLQEFMKDNDGITQLGIMIASVSFVLILLFARKLQKS